MPDAITEPSFDLFISYAHKDDADGWVTALVETIKAEHAEFTAQPLSVFFDRSDISDMQDWEHRILAGLRGAKVMLAVLSPLYFQSSYCRREWEVYLDHEVARGLVNEGIAPIYTVTVPDFEADAKANLDNWLRNMRRRQYVDVRPWRLQGPNVLQLADVRRRMALLDQQLAAKIDRFTAVQTSPTTVPQHNGNFVGRNEELRLLRESLALGRIGAVTTIHGLGGIGKSALAFEYAHAYADKYPGGRFLINAEGAKDLRTLLVSLADNFGVDIAPEERADLETCYSRVRVACEHRPLTLLILDNVDNQKLLSSEHCVRYLPCSDRLHTMVTTRLAVENRDGLVAIQMDGLPDNEAVRLMEKFRRFSTEDDRKAASTIAERLGGFTLAIELVGAFLWKHPEVSYGAYLERLVKGNVQTLIGAGAENRVELTRHHTKVITTLLQPTLNSLADSELLAIEYAALFPPDHIGLQWIRALVGRSHAELTSDPSPGYPDPWMQLQRRLFGLHLLTPAGDSRARMHRLVQDVVLYNTKSKTRAVRRQAIIEYAKERAASHWGRRLEGDFRTIYPLYDFIIEPSGFEYVRPFNQLLDWESGLLADLSRHLLNRNDGDGVVLANWAFGLLRDRMGVQFLTPEICRDLLLQATAGRDGATNPINLAACYAHLVLTAPDLLVPAVREGWEWAKHAQALLMTAGKLGLPYKSRVANNIAKLAVYEGDFLQARDLIQEAIHIADRAFTNRHSLRWVRNAKHYSNTSRAVLYYNLACVEKELNHWPEARRLLRIVCDMESRGVSLDPLTALFVGSTLAEVEAVAGNVDVAQALYEKVNESVCGMVPADHPGRVRVLANRALLRHRAGRTDECREDLRRCRAALEAVSPGGADAEGGNARLARCYFFLGMAEKEAGDLSAARGSLERACGIQERLRDPFHLKLASYLQELALIEERAGESARAVALLRRVVNLRKKALPDAKGEISSGPVGPGGVEALREFFDYSRRAGEFDANAERLWHAIEKLGSLEVAAVSEGQWFAFAASRWDESGLDKTTEGFQVDRLWRAMQKERWLGGSVEMEDFGQTATDTCWEIFEGIKPPGRDGLIICCLLFISESSPRRWLSEIIEGSFVHAEVLVASIKESDQDAAPWEARAYYRLGRLAELVANIDEARKYYQQAIALGWGSIRHSDEPAEFCLGLAQMEEKAGNLQAAREAYEVLFKQAEQPVLVDGVLLAQFYFGLGRTLVNQGSRSKGEAFIRKATMILAEKTVKDHPVAKTCAEWFASNPDETHGRHASFGGDDKAGPR